MRATPGTSKPTIRTLLLCDLVASTRLVERVGDSAAADLLAIARDLLSTFNRREIDRSDDCVDEVPYDFRVECARAQHIPKEEFGF